MNLNLTDEEFVRYYSSSDNQAMRDAAERVEKLLSEVKYWFDLAPSSYR